MVEFFAILGALYLLFVSLAKLSDFWRTRFIAKIEKVRGARHEIEQEREKLAQEVSEARQEVEQKRRKLAQVSRQLKKDRQAISLLADEKSKGFPWLAEAYSDYYHLQDLEEAKYLQRKAHPARRAAKKLREMA